MIEQLKENFKVIEKLLKKDVDYSLPSSILEHLKEIQSIQGLLIELKAKFEYYLISEMGQKVKLSEGNSEREKKISLSNLTKKINYYNSLSELAIKEFHYRVEMLRSALSYLKSESQNL